jgi:hypothetical protein
MLLSHGSDRKTFGDIISSQPMRTIGLVASLLEVSLYQGQVHLIVHSWLLFRFSLTFIYKSMRQAMKQCNSVRKDEEVYDHNIWTCYYRTRSKAIKIKLKCIISFSEWCFATGSMMSRRHIQYLICVLVLFVLTHILTRQWISRPVVR